MIRVEEVRPGLWLGLSQPSQPIPLRGAPRRRADEAAADRALAACAHAAGIPRGRWAMSRAHTAGAGAALLGPPGSALGVDVVQVERVTERHARAVVGDPEYRALECFGRMAAPLAWALKEAAVKAVGLGSAEIAPSRRRGHVAIQAGRPPRVLDAGWTVAGPFLYAWVWMRRDS